MAQNNVGVGTNTPDASAKIDITSSNKGLLIPRVALTSTTDATTIPTPATSLLIYNTATAGSSPNNVTPGFYYNSGTSTSPIWTKLATATSTNEWSLAGNTGISEPASPSVYGTSVIGSSDNFLGTKDVKDLTFGTNSIERMRIKSTTGNIGIGTANPTAKLEVANADAKINTLTIGKGGGSQFENTAIGADALQFNTSSGDQNTAIGFRVLNINNIGRLNTAAGAYTLKNNTTGSYNTGFGTGSLINNSTGNGNIGIGFNAMAANTTGSYNTVIGHFSNVGSNDLSNATAIGSNAMVRSNNSLILGDTINNVRVGIGTTSPDNSTVLDIISSSKGVRLPNIALTSTTDGATVSSPVTSLLIYNTATVSDVTPGFYYNSNTPVSPIWTRLNTSTTLDTLGWTKALTSSTKADKADNQYVTGNIGLGDFSAAAPLDKIHVKGNLRIDSGRIDFRNTGQSVFVGEGAGINDDLAARSNVAIGYNSLNQNTTGNNNVAIGTGALEKNTASFNTAVGRRALNSVTTGYTNAAFGESTLRASTTGFENTAFGQASLRFNVTGNRNTVVGSAAGYNNTGSANIFFGYQAGFNETGNNKLYIENSNSATPLIYGDFASNHITINDSLTSKYFQMTNGAANGFVLRSDATGNSTWTNPATLISDTASWTKALTTTTKATKTDNQYVTGKVGIGDFSSSSPSANLHVIGNGIIGSSSNTVTGINSLATGNGNTLSGNYSFTTGQFNNNAAENSITAGILTRIESGYGHSIAVGYTDTLAASAAVVFGFGNKVTGFEGFAAGDRNKVTGQTAVAFGSSNNANGNNSFVLGENNNAASLNEVTLGMNGTTYSASSISTYNATDRILNVGNGVNSSTRSDAFTILKNGNIGVNNSTPNTSAILDINSASKGVRMPNVALTSTTDAATIATPANSLLIYNTATAGVSPNNVTPGFYYNSNTSVSPIWTRLNTSAVVDTLGWTKALTTNTSASKSDNQYVTGKVGIGDFSASTPNANIQVIGNGNIGAGNTISGSNSLVTGNGNTLSGNYSIATGQFNYNAAENSIIAGYFSRIESGYGHSISVGYADTIAASSAAVFGVGNKVTAYEGFAAGDKNKVSGQTAAAFGGSNNATASNAFVTGGRNTVSASNAFAAGNNNIANGNNSFVNGSDNTASSFSETAIGLYGTNYTPNSTTIYNATDRVLNVGNGVNSSTRSDAFTILKNGNIGVNNSTPNSSAILDITATNKGVRLPNVALTSTTDAATIATPATSLLVYNTATAGVSPNNVIPGFYYNSNTSASPIWTRLNTSAIADTLGWTKALTTNTKAIKSDNQYVTGKVGIGDFSATSPNANLQVIGNGIFGSDNNTVSGTNSIAAGAGTDASGDRTFVIGENNLNAADNSIVAGYFSRIENGYGHSIVVGYTDTVEASSAAAFGYGSKVNGFSGFAAGDRNKVSGQSAASFGANNNAMGDNSFAIGQDNYAVSYGETSIGVNGTYYTPSSSTSYDLNDRIFNIGNGTSTSNRSDALTILKNGNTGIGTANPTAKLEVANADAKINALTIGKGGGSQYENTAIGTDVLRFNTNSGDQNTGIGYRTLYVNNIGRLNTASGVYTLTNNTSGSFNTGFGAGSLTNNTTGSGNISIGYNTMPTNTTGSYNTVIGHSSNVGSNNLSNATAIGSNAMVRSSNTLILGDTINNVRVGIGTTTPNNSTVLDINSTSKGVRLPNIALTSTTDAATIATPATSLLVYNTATAGVSPNNVVPGFYYNSNTSASPIWKRFNSSIDTLGWTKALTVSTKAIKTDNQYITGNIGLGDFSSITPSNNVSFATGSNKTIGAERSTTAGTYYNLTVQAGGAMVGQNNNHGGDLVLSGGIATGNGGSAADLGSNVIIKTATPLGSSSSADQTPTEKMRIKGDGTVNIADLALTNGGDRRVFVDANGNLKAYDGVTANRNVVMAANHTVTTATANTTATVINNSGTMNVAVGDVLIINAQVTLRLTTGSNTDDFFVRVTNSGTATVVYSNATINPYNLIYRPDEGGGDHDNYRPTPYLEYGTVTAAGTVNFSLIAQNTGDDDWEYRNAVIVVRKE